MTDTPKMNTTQSSLFRFIGITVIFHPGQLHALVCKFRWTRTLLPAVSSGREKRKPPHTRGTERQFFQRDFLVITGLRHSISHDGPSVWTQGQELWQLTLNDFCTRTDSLTSYSLLTSMASRNSNTPLPDFLVVLLAVCWLLLRTTSVPWLSWKLTAAC